MCALFARQGSAWLITYEANPIPVLNHNYLYLVCFLVCVPNPVLDDERRSKNQTIDGIRLLRVELGNVE